MDRQNIDIEKIMIAVKASADEKRQGGQPLKYAQMNSGVAVSGDKYDASLLRDSINMAVSKYAYRYGAFPGNKVKAGIKKFLSMIIRPAARPCLLDQTEYNRNVVQAINQIALSESKVSTEEEREEILKLLSQSEGRISKLSGLVEKHYK